MIWKYQIETQKYEMPVLEYWHYTPNYPYFTSRIYQLPKLIFM